jgi:hypothetical protein
MWTRKDFVLLAEAISGSTLPAAYKEHIAARVANVCMERSARNVNGWRTFDRQRFMTAATQE